MVRSKFKCESKTITADGATVKLSPVIGGSKENENFFKYTPYGNIEIGVLNDSAKGFSVAAEFEPGKEYFVDFSKAE